jgi:hypothetical protein
MSPLWICIVYLLSLFSANATDLTLNLYDPSDNLLCNDGTPGGFYFRPAPEDASEAERSLWVFHLQGGGWCWDKGSCVQRIQENNGGELGRDSHI